MAGPVVVYGLQIHLTRWQKGSVGQAAGPVTDTTADRFTLIHDSPAQVAVCLGNRQDRSGIGGTRPAAVAHRAGTGVALGQMLVAATCKAGAVTHRVHAVRAIQRVLAVHCVTMTGTALDDGAGMPLQLLRGDIVVGHRIGIRPLGMRCTVASFAEHATMPSTHAVQPGITRARV